MSRIVRSVRAQTSRSPPEKLHRRTSRTRSHAADTLRSSFDDHAAGRVRMASTRTQATDNPSRTASPRFRAARNTASWSSAIWLPASVHDRDADASPPRSDWPSPAATMSATGVSRPRMCGNAAGNCPDEGRHLQAEARGLARERRQQRRGTRGARARREGAPPRSTSLDALGEEMLVMDAELAARPRRRRPPCDQRHDPLPSGTRGPQTRASESSAAVSAAPSCARTSGSSARAARRSRSAGRRATSPTAATRAAAPPAPRPARPVAARERLGDAAQTTHVGRAVEPVTGGPACGTGKP